MFAASPPPAVSEIEVLRRKARQRFWRYFGGALILGVSLGGVFGAFNLNSPVLPLALLAILALPLLLWHKPIAAVYLVLGCACLIELAPAGLPGVLSDQIPFFWNVNTIIQRFARVSFEAIPFSPLEFLIAAAVGISCFRAAFSGSARLRFGPLGLFFGGYLLFVLGGWLNGILQGGDFKISLQEVRPQVYLAIAYLMALNVVEEKHIPAMLWITGGCVALKGLDYTWRRYALFRGQAVPDQGVGSHEEAFFFTCFFLLVAVLLLCRSHPRLCVLMVTLSPLVLLGNVATNRRAGSAALLLCVPLLMLMAFRLFPRYRRAIVLTAVIAGLLWVPYYEVFKNREGVVAGLARAVRSKRAPNARDAASNAYRDAEDANLFHTIRQSPVIGYGYGRPFLVVVPMADISKIYEYWNILPHNQVLWIWMRVGTGGFVVFWLLYAAMLVVCVRVAVQQEGNYRVAGLFAASCAAALTMFGLYDLQFSNARDMLFVGLWVGAAAGAYKPEARTGWDWSWLRASPKEADSRLPPARGER